MGSVIRFNDSLNNMYFGRNYDEDQVRGINVMFAPHDYHYQPVFDAEDKNKAVLGVGKFEDGYPVYYDCANEQGLAVASVDAEEADYAEETVNFTTNIAVYEFPLWVTRCFESVDEVTEALENVTIVNQDVDSRHPTRKLRWLVSDIDRCVVVEATKDGVTWHNDPYGVLTDGPSFTEQLAAVKDVDALKDVDNPRRLDAQDLTEWQTGDKDFGVPVDKEDPDADQFARAAFINTHYMEVQGEDNNLGRLFATLASVAMPAGAKNEAGDALKTLYTSGYSASERKYYLRSSLDSTIHAYAMEEFNNEATQIILAEKH